jgi:hypothetical protein
MSSYSEGQTHQLMEALEREKWTAQDVTLLGQFKNLAGIRTVLRGLAEIKSVEHLIDLAANPFIPEDWTVEEHKKGGQWKWDPTKVKLYPSDQQQAGKCIKGDDLRKEFEDKPVLNANVLDYLLQHPHLIPDVWKGKWVFFWGTIYRGPYGFLYVRCLYWGGGAWFWGYYWLGYDWCSGRPALVRAS